MSQTDQQILQTIQTQNPQKPSKKKTNPKAPNTHSAKCNQPTNQSENNKNKTPQWKLKENEKKSKTKAMHALTDMAQLVEERNQNENVKLS